MRILAATALILATVATPAFAQSEDKPFEGFHVAAVTGWDHVDDGVDKEDGVTGGVAAGYDFQLKDAGVVLGLEGEATLATTERCVGTSCIKAGRDLYAGARVGIPVSDTVMVYAKGGYTNARANYTLNGTTVTTDDLDGVRAGVGIEGVVGKLLLRVEYRYSNYEQDFERHQVVAGVGIRF